MLANQITKEEKGSRAADVERERRTREGRMECEEERKTTRQAKGMTCRYWLSSPVCNVWQGGRLTVGAQTQKTHNTDKTKIGAKGEGGIYQSHQGVEERMDGERRIDDEKWRPTS